MQSCHIIIGKVLQKNLCKDVPLSMVRLRSFRGSLSAHVQVNEGVHDL